MYIFTTLEFYCQKLDLKLTLKISIKIFYTQEIYKVKYIYY